MTPANSLTFFVLDDDSVILSLMVKLLELEGHQVVYANDSLDAVAEIAKLKPDCLITDLVMPGRDGLDVVGDICEHGGLGSITIIMVTTRTKEMWQEMARAKGVHGFISKPIDPAAFAGQVMAIVSDHKA